MENGENGHATWRVGNPKISEEDPPLEVFTQLKIRPKILGD